MKKGYTHLSLQVPKPVKRWLKSEADRLAVSVNAVARAILIKNANATVAEEVTK